MSENIRGCLWMVVAMLLFSGEDAFYKSVTEAGVSPGFGLFLFGLFGAVIFSVACLRKGQPALHAGMFRRPLLIRSGCELAGRLFFALALAWTPLSTTSAILQANPLVVTAGAALMLGEAVGPRRWSAMGVGLIGVLLILRPLPGDFHVDAILAIIAMLGFAGRDLATRVAPVTVSPLQLGVLGFGVVMLAGVLIMVIFGEVPALPGLQSLAELIGMAVVGTAAYGALTRAMRTGEVGVVSPFRYVRLLAALVLAWVVFGERPDIWMLAGGVLIVASGLYTLMRSRAVAATAGTGKG